MRSLLAAALVLLPRQALAEELTPETAADIQHERQAAIDKVNADHGNKKSSELSTDERRQIIQEQSAAQAAVLEKHGVEAKDYARYNAKMPLEDRKRAAAETDKLKAADEAAKAGPVKPAGPGPNGASPAVSNAPGGGTTETQNGIVIEKGTAEAKKADADAQAASAPAAPPAEAPKKKKHRRSKKDDE